MSNESQSNKRLAKNTLILYARMLFTVGISLYTSRVILANLGVSDFGLYNVIGGFISMFYMVTSSMSASISRFLTFELGKKDIKRQILTFSTSVNIQIILSLIVLLIGETLGLWFVNNKMSFEPERLFAANIVYQLAVFSFISELVGIPYYSSVVAHERMNFYAYITIFNVILKLVIAFMIAISPIDKVVFYALCMLLTGVLTQFSYFLYCRKKFYECRYKLVYDGKIFRQMFSFGGWSFLSSVSSMMRGQGVNILLNMFYGTVVNAAYGIARQIDGTVKAFSNNFIMALNPQITKSYAEGDKGHARALVYKGTKYSFLLLFMIAFPVMMETKSFLDIWLVSAPDYSVVFVQLTLILALVEVLLKPMWTLNNATGDVMMYQIIMSVSQFMVLPICYIMLKLGYNPYSTMYVTIGAELVTLYPRIWVNRKNTGVTLMDYNREIIFRLAPVVFFAFIGCSMLSMCMHPSIVRILLIFVCSTLVIAITSYSFALNKQERKFFVNSISKLLIVFG